MKLGIDDMTRVAERRYYLKHRGECALAIVAFFAGLTLLFAGIVPLDSCEDGMKWTHVAVTLVTLGGVTLLAVIAWSVWYEFRRGDWVRETVQRWVDEEGKEQTKK